jgi:hypothetical protein
MSVWEDSFGNDFYFPARCPLDSLRFDTAIARALPELRGCDCHHSRAPSFMRKSFCC